MKRFEHGQTVRDIITGVEGVVTGRVDYITGCNQYLVQPRTAPDGSPREAKWFDEQRLSEVDAERIELANEANGADEEAPIK
jgi:hypothetical protein